MGWWARLFGRARPRPQAEQSGVLPILVHCHPRDALPPGPLEPGMVELERDDVILHALAGVVNPDGTICDLPPEKLEWARRLVYRHFKREGCLEEFGIPIIPAYETEEA
jgi:hypothetical protein